MQINVSGNLFGPMGNFEKYVTVSPSETLTGFICPDYQGFRLYWVQKI